MEKTKIPGKAEIENALVDLEWWVRRWKLGILIPMLMGQNCLGF